MNYDWLKYEEIEKSKYPNLLAEIKESGYSICTISELMELGRCEEDNQNIWNKLTGRTKILKSEAVELAKYYNVKLDYLFADKLSVIFGKSEAYWRWYDSNLRKQQELERSKEIKKIYDALVADPELLQFMKWCMSLTEEQRHELVLRMQKEAIA